MLNRNLILTLSITVAVIIIQSCSSTMHDFSSEKHSSGSKIFKPDTAIKSFGKHVTSAGAMRTLIIYALFPDDSINHSDRWEYSVQKLPGWTRKMINNSKLIDFTDNNLTQYFYEMSNGNFLLYGDIYPTVVVPKLDQKKYKSIMEVNYEILRNLDDEIDFSKYDNWRRNKDGEFINEPDGKVDLIFIIYRDFEDALFFNKGWTAAAHLYLTKDILTNDGVKIAKGRLGSGSGIQSRGGRHGLQYLKYVLAHEFGHFLFGGGHIENVTNLALMTGGPVWNASRGMHSWEKEKLGWNKFKDIPVGQNSSILINDYLSTGEAYRLKLSEEEWFVFENHQGVSPNDKAKDKGIYIYHITNATRFAPTIDVECADGKWEFYIDSENRKLIKTIPSRTGRTEMNFRKGDKNKNYACYEEVYEDNSAWGDKYDAFDTDYNNLFSPVSIPSSENKLNIDFAVNIQEKKGNSYLVNISFIDIYEKTPPSKPQIKEVKNQNDKVILTWLPNLEPDLAAYNIYYSDFKEKEFKLYETINSTTSENLIDISSLLRDKANIFSVALTALDKTGNASLFSDFFKISYDHQEENWQFKRVEEH